MEMKVSNQGWPKIQASIMTSGEYIMVQPDKLTAAIQMVSLDEWKTL